MDPNVDLRNWLTLQAGLKRATDVLHHVFLNRWKVIHDGRQWTNGKDTGQEFINGIGSVAYRQATDPQKTVLEAGDVTHWDITTTAMVLKKATFTKKGDTNFERQVDDENRMIQQVTDVRNQVKHLTSMTVSKEVFDKLWAEMAQAMVALGDCKDELDIMRTEEGILCNKDFSNENNNTAATKLKDTGNTLFKEGMWHEAIEAYSEALALTDLNAQIRATVLSNRAAAYLKLGDNLYTKTPTPAERTEDFQYRALYDAKEAVMLWPTWWRGYYRAGCAYSSMNKMEKAIRYLDKALALEPTKREVLEARDYARHQSGVQSRMEHLDMRKLFGPTVEVLKHMNKTVLNMSPETYRNFADAMKSRDDPSADCWRAHRYYFGFDGFPVDYSRAAECFRKAADKGDAEGIYNLAVHMTEGKGVKRDIPQAVKLLKQAAEMPAWIGPGIPNLGVAEAQHTLGLCYNDGVGVPKDPTAATRWYELASKNGCPHAANNLGQIYLHGTCVQKDEPKAVQYLKLAAIRRDPNAMQTLAGYHLRKGEVKLARDWFKRAIDNGNALAALTKDKFENLVRAVISHLKLVAKFEEEHGLTAENMTLEGRTIRMMSSALPKESQAVKEEILANNFKTHNLPAEISDNSLQFDYKEVVRYANSGSLTAKRIQTAQEHFFTALLALIKIDQYKQISDVPMDLCVNFISCLAHAIRTEHIVIRLPQNKETMIAVVRRILESCGTSKCQLDIDARYCYAFLHGNSLEEMVTFYKGCSQKYKEEADFHKSCCCCLAFLHRYKEGLAEADAALKVSPTDYYEALYNRAGMLRLIEDNNNPAETLKAYETFLKAAPADHRKVPESYYAMANVIFAGDGKNVDPRVWKEFLSKAEVYYNKGLEAEKLQLPFFLPYHSNSKLMAEKLIGLVNHKSQHLKGDSSRPRSPVDAKGNGSKHLKNPYRIEIICYHRNRINFVRGLTHVLYTTRPALKTQKAPASIAELKPITFRDMDPLSDRIYEGSAVLFTVIEDANARNYSISTIIQDANGDVHRLYVYNFERQHDEAAVQGTFGFGCRMYVINPYMRFAHDRKPAIRVDDPSTIVQLSDENCLANPCRFCLKEDAKHACSRCRVARYCSRQCQEDDWKIYKHKLICNSHVYVSGSFLL